MSKCKILFWLSCFMFLNKTTSAAGLWLYDIGSADSGHAVAGRAALGQDASAAGSNPASMTLLTGDHLTLGLQGLYVDTKFKTENSGADGGSGGQAGGFVPIASFSYVHSVSEDLKLGLVTGSYFGLGLDYGASWAGRYHVIDSELTTFGINPSIGYRLNDNWSIGAGINILNSTLKQKTAINNSVLDPGTPDGLLVMDQDDFGYGYNLGLLYNYSSETRFGLTYRSKIDLEFDDFAELRGIGTNLSSLLAFAGVNPQRADIEMSTPQSVMFSGFHQLTDNLAILANIGWQDWNDFGTSQITVSGANTTRLTDDRGFNDTYHLALGLQYKYTNDITLMSGVAYDSSPVDDDYRTPDMPLDRQIRISTGISYDITEQLNMGCSYTFMDAGKAAIDQQGGPLSGPIKGDYRNNYIHFFALNLNYSF